MTSIRRHLLTYLIAALLLSSILISFLTHMVAKHELNELYNENMRQLAELLLAQELSSRDESGTAHKKLSGEEEFLIQLWDKEHTLFYSSHEAIPFPLQPKEGYGRVEFEGRQWLYFQLTRNGITVQLSQVYGEREEAVMEVALNILLPVFIQLPLLGWLIWLIVGRGLRPIDNLSLAIRARGSDALHPLPYTDVPLEVKPLVAALNGLLERLGSALKAQRQFTADAAHELRTPLTALQLQLDILKRSQSEEEQAEAIAKLSEGVKRCIHVARQLLSMAHQEPEAMEQPFSPVDLVALARDTATLFDSILHQKNMTLSLPSPEENIQISGNKAALRIMLENLLDNAIRYTAEGGKAAIRIERLGERVALTIADNGRGIPLEEYERVFDRFYRITGTGQSGTGLGLAIVRQIAARHHATVELHEGLEGKGLSVRVVFPVLL